jgi:hypothetical protein
MWKFRKYRQNPESELRAIIQHVNTRKRRGKESEIYKNSRRIPMKNIAKECSRYGIPLTLLNTQGISSS